MAARKDGLGTRGVRVFNALGGTKLDPLRKELAVEAGRMADRLEALHGLIEGRGLEEQVFYRLGAALDEKGAARVELLMDRPMAEARQLQLAFDRLIKDLAAPAAAAEPAKPKAEEPVDELAARIAARRAARAAAGS